MIQPKTLEALNYFINEDIEICKGNIEETQDNERLNAFYRGQLTGLENAKMWINTPWKEENED